MYSGETWATFFRRALTLTSSIGSAYAEKEMAFWKVACGSKVKQSSDSAGLRSVDDNIRSNRAGLRWNRTSCGMLLERVFSFLTQSERL
jgi:hypothetical protein